MSNKPEQQPIHKPPQGLQRTEFIINHSGWAVATIDSETNTIDFCNAAFAAMHGCTPEQLIGSPLEKTFAPEWMTVWPAHRLRLARGGDYIYESLHIRKGGHVFPVRTHATTFLDAQEKPIFRASIFTDISQERLTQHALIESEALKTAMLDSGLDAFIAIDHESRILEFNSAAEETFGYPRAEVLGRSLDELIIPPSLRQQHARGMARYLASGESKLLGKRIEISAMRSDGSEFPCELAIVRVNREGPPIFTSFIRDITKRRTAEISGQLLSAIVESSDDAIVSKDLNGIVTSWNKGAERIFGYTAAEMIDNPITLIIPPDRLSEEPRILAQIRGGGRIDHFETIRRRKDGVLLNVSVTISPIRSGAGEIVGASKVARDITDTVRAKEKLEQLVAERTAHLSATIGELERFSYSLSHDMRAPLRAIHSFLQIVLDDAGTRLTEQERDLLHKSVNAAGRLDRLIQDVLAYSKVARDDIQLHAVDVIALLRQIIDERPDFHPPVSEIAIDCPTPPALGHEAYLTQVITNLLGNAIKFVAPGVQPRIRITCELLDDRVRLCFVDNGIGILEEAREKIFGMFQRMHADSEYPGTGIGLAIVRKAAERMRATITVDPAANGGSCFLTTASIMPFIHVI